MSDYLKMLCSHRKDVLFLIYIINFSLIGPAPSHGSKHETKVLNVGEELQKETIPLQSGSRLYHLQGLKSHTWYEVKISYPASIPATFSLQLKKDSSGLELNRERKLLNTEKLIFKTDVLNLLDNQGAMFVLVTVEPEGVVAIRGVQERKFIIFNIVCDELYLGIPEKAWYVVVLVILCLVVAFVIPSFLPPYLLPRSQNRNILDQVISKDS
ncbi:uncharacterized protein LOC116019085 isoform X2 [Ipomoea triloba]|uniref:uncharacterized protein LOC116019085 isoform X2 n=1 Tax=Ipomoea triloba TaxID=35885 RepID=UPI00125CF55A|nr:uncharacterized protein LOC116019085 isoform X2 [Ipomoea triloba]